MTKMAFIRKAGRFAQHRSRFREDRRCVWCGITMRKSIGRWPRPTDPTREHIIPKSKGGGGGKNLGAACRACNNRRGNDERWLPWASVPGAVRGIAYRWEGDDLVRLHIHMPRRQTS